jgi:octaprenyl-diphosphate synthase
MVELTGSRSAVPKTTVDLLQLFEPVRADLVEVEREYLRQVESKVGVIPEIGAYIQKSGGKRVRPALLLMAARLCGYTGPRAVLNAAVVEFIHTATLVHDDIIDDAETRRGQKAVHSRWGNDVTVLAGDFLYIKSMAMALTQDTLDVVRLLCDITLRMIEGEIYQLTKNGDIDITEDEHFDIIRRKTAHLFGGCAEIGAMLGEAGPEKRTALREYGFSLGILFQLVDDQLDFTGEAEALGKPVGGDLLEGKMTLPLIHLRDHAGPEAMTLIRRIVAERQASPDDWARIRHLLAEHRSLEYAQARARAFGEAAIRHLSIFPDRPERDALVALAEFVIDRDR